MNPSHKFITPTSDALSEKARYWNGVPERDREQIEGITVQLRHHLRSKNLNSLQIGQLLLRAKAKIKHGYFSDWLETEFGGIRTAQRDMREAKLYAGRFVAVSKLPRHLLHQLSQKAMPGHIRAEIVRRCEQASDSDLAGVVAYARAQIPKSEFHAQEVDSLSEPNSYEIDKVRQLTITLNAIGRAHALAVIDSLNGLGLRILAQQLARNVSKGNTTIEHALHVE